MLTPIVTEISRVPEPVVRDTFIREFDLRGPRARAAASARVVALAPHRTRRARAAAAPARAA